MIESFATILETVADLRADRVAVTHGAVSRTWRELDERAARLAGHLAAAGVQPDSRVAIGLYNGTAYLESVFAVLKLRAVPVNVNYRYQKDELVSLLQDAGAEALIFDVALAQRVTAAGAELSRLRALVQVGGTSEDLAYGAVAYERALADAEPAARIERGDDSWLMYTGGTTGKPKGVLVRHSWLYQAVSANGFLLLGEMMPSSLDELRATTRRLSERGDAMVCLPAPPLMHSTGMYTSFGALLASGRVVYLSAQSYDPDELARLVQEQRVDTVSIVGDVFARPLADALDRAAGEGRPFDVSSLRRVISVGVTWSADVKSRLLAHGDFVCRDLVAASEGGPFAVRETRRGDEVATARFTLMPGARVLDLDTGDVEPGSGQIGMLAAPADDHIRYLGDDAKTAETFRVIDGTRWVVPGDLASLELDGTVVFHGRDSRVINTGGEKVFAEEVEQVILTHPGIRDALIVGVADERWGHRIVALVALHDGVRLTLGDLRDHVGRELADYKRPKEVVVVTNVRRTPSGKADLSWALQTALSPSTHEQEIS